MSRYTSRIHVLNLVYQIPFHAEWDESLLNAAIVQYLADLPDLEEYLPDLLEYMPTIKALNEAGIGKDISPVESDREFIFDEVSGTFCNLAQIDGLISDFLKDWELGRIAKIDLALLRLAVYEMRFSEDEGLSTATAINQAVELAKIYNGSPGFVNGILGQIDRQSQKSHKGKNDGAL